MPPSSSRTSAAARSPAASKSTRAVAAAAAAVHVDQECGLREPGEPLIVCDDGGPRQIRALQDQLAALRELSEDELDAAAPQWLEVFEKVHADIKHCDGHIKKQLAITRRHAHGPQRESAMESAYEAIPKDSAGEVTKTEFLVPTAVYRPTCWLLLTIFSAE